LNKKYPNHQFGMDNRIMLRDLEKIVNGDNLSTSKITYLKPDGGFLWIKINGKKYYILISEQKQQGTNDQRLLEGKFIQGKGNAVERLGKNLIGCETLFLEEDIFPFIVFLQGCDFYDNESTIGDRVRTIFRFLPGNTVNLFYVGRRAGSYFMRGHSMTETPGTSDWTNKEMFENMFTIAVTSVEYYLKKYGK
jgi:type II restriction enzyme